MVYEWGRGADECVSECCWCNETKYIQLGIENMMETIEQILHFIMNIGSMKKIQCLHTHAKLSKISNFNGDFRELNRSNSSISITLVVGLVIFRDFYPCIVRSQIHEYAGSNTEHEHEWRNRRCVCALTRDWNEEQFWIFAEQNIREAVGDETVEKQ